MKRQSQACRRLARCLRRSPCRLQQALHFTLWVLRPCTASRAAAHLKLSLGRVGLEPHLWHRFCKQGRQQQPHTVVAPRLEHRKTTMTPLHKLRLLSTAAAALVMTFAAGAHAAPIYSNGAVVDGSGLSVLVSPASTYGWGAQSLSGKSVADDFTVPLGSNWNVHSLSLYSYQTGATAFTFTTATWQIIAGDVNTGTVVSTGTAVVTNEGEGPLGYRVANTSPTSTSRPIYQLGVDIADIELASGSYWLTWSLGGTLASGPWAVPTLDDVGGNAAQRVPPGSFASIVDAGSRQNHELAFALNGVVNSSFRSNTVPEPGSLALVLAAALAAGWSRKAAAGRRMA